MVFNYLRQLSIFENPDDNEYQQRSNIIATRIYIITFLVTLTMIIIGLWLTPETNSLMIAYPTEEQVRTLPHDAECPCSRLSFPYGTFVTVNGTFHPICSSDFVSDRWIQMLFSASNATDLYSSDIRSIGNSLFQILASLCRLSEKRFQTGLDSLYTSQFISPSVLYDNLLQSMIEAYILEFQLTLSFLFQSELNLFGEMMFANQLIPALDSTLSLYYYDQIYAESTELSILERAFLEANGSYCYCTRTYSCTEQMGIYPVAVANSSYPEYIDVSIWNISGLVSSCTAMHSLLQSTLECFYNQTCLNTTVSYFDTQENFTAMPIPESSQFQLNSTVQSIVNRLMLEQLTYNVSYKQYFNQCIPLSCTYIMVQRRSFGYILTKIIGLLGGLTITLGILVPATVRYIRNRRLAIQSAHRTSLRYKIIEYKSRLSHILSELNFFETRTNDDRYIHHERRITRIFVLLLGISFTVVVIYFLSTKDIYQKTVPHPTESVYLQLKTKYNDDATCSCTQLSTSFGKFISITPTYHPICSSDFVSDDWLNFLALFTSYMTISGLRYQKNFVTQFSILNIFCTNAAQTVEDARGVFLENRYVTSEVVDGSTFQEHFSSLVEQWKLTTQNQYQRLIELIQQTTQGNRLASYLQNVDFRLNLTTKEMFYQPLNYSNCSCELSGLCSMSIEYPSARSSVFDNFGRHLEYPNLLVGCFPVAALFQSELIGLTNQTYVDQIVDSLSTVLLDYTPPKNFTALDLTDQEKTEQVGSIVNRLMINSWNVTVSFPAYFNSCSPICTYEYTSYRSAIVVLSVVIGVFGGLSRCLKLIISILITFIEDIMKINSFNSIFQFFKCIFDVHDDQTRTNRLHFIFLLSITMIVYLISYLPVQTKTTLINQPSRLLHEDLLQKYSDTLECSCSKISIDYRSFITIQPRFHPLCSSELVSDDWIMYVYKRTNESFVLAQNQLLSAFCQLSERTVNDTLSQFITSSYVNTRLMSSDALNEQIQQLVEQFGQSTAQSFIDTLDFIRHMTAKNTLLNMYSTNWKYEPIKFNSRYWNYHTFSLQYNQCDCGLSSTCTQSIGNITLGCLPLDGLLQSTIGFLYDQQYVDSNEEFQALNASFYQSQFNYNSTVKFLLEKLFVEEYLTNVSYENYFNQCHVSTCSYSYYGNGNLMDTTLLVIELFGGLIIISLWITAGFIKLYQYLRRRCLSTESS
ncbi:unnamed protein product [Adineta ricciae]|uniref:Uncharacterized protein n=2 Tax=Adineta ricciae TaxID=249248 RepID=A0A815NJD8_ADIRI|nr:unnamed protein product [Adineta ricciae]